jgi:coenzyme Q-binding protein COQ10
MPKFETTRIVKHSPQVMFDLVADIERYPEFVPMCSALNIRRRSEAARTKSEGEGENPGAGRETKPVVTLVADMSIGYKMIRETFTTRVTLDSDRATIHVSYVDGPFRHLENRWTFAPDPVGCAVRFFIDYEFKSRTFQMLAGAVFETVFRKMAEAFENRADELARKKSLS